MHSHPSSVQPELCLTPTQTQLLLVITSISGCLRGVLNYKSCKTRIKLLKPLIGGEGAVKLSLWFNWPNFAKASGLASGLWVIGNVFVVSLNKYVLASLPLGHKKSQGEWEQQPTEATCTCGNPNACPCLMNGALTSLCDGRWAKWGSNVSYGTTGHPTSLAWESKLYQF